MSYDYIAAQTIFNRVQTEKIWTSYSLIDTNCSQRVCTFTMKGQYKASPSVLSDGAAGERKYKTC
ncbi:MAG: hypothetical protein LBU65_09640 [Planctomycetaceae bacterium]|nr:hypothetical protein [Planctomycetaceae bacterium]